MADIHLSTQGPHSPEYTRQVADLFAEAVRTLNYASMSGNGGLTYPGDVYSLLGALYTGTGRLPQLFTQLGAFLDAQAGSGRLGDDHGRDVTTQIASAAFHLGAAHQVAADLTAELRAVQNAIAGLYVREGTDG